MSQEKRVTKLYHRGANLRWLLVVYEARTKGQLRTERNGWTDRNKKGLKSKQDWGNRWQTEGRVKRLMMEDINAEKNIRSFDMTGKGWNWKSKQEWENEWVIERRRKRILRNTNAENITSFFIIIFFLHEWEALKGQRRTGKWMRDRKEEINARKHKC